MAILLVPPLAVLAGCGSDPNLFPPACPRATILGDAADLTQFAPTQAGQPGQDLTDMVLDGRITGVAGNCQRGDNGNLNVTTHLQMELTRGPAMRGQTETVPYFLAVAEGQRILDKKVFQIPAKFPANTDRIWITSDDVAIVLPVEKGKSGAAYDVIVGFQLTPDQLALNRRRGMR